MRTMTRNRRVFYQASLVEVAMAQDTDGNYTEESYTYSDPVRCEGVISVASGAIQMQLFGATESYDKVIMLNKEEDYLVVGSVLWVDRLPEINEQGKTTTPYDYIVVKVAESLNFIHVAIRKVDVS